MTASFTPRDIARRVVAMVAAKHRVKAAEILSDAKSARIVRARYAAFVEISQMFPKWSAKQIGRFFDRDHSTVIYAFTKLNYCHPGAFRAKPPADDVGPIAGPQCCHDAPRDGSDTLPHTLTPPSTVCSKQEWANGP